MTTAMVNKNAVVSHCTVWALISSSFISRGSATPMIVSLRITTKAATSSVAMIAVELRGMAAVLSDLVTGADMVVSFRLRARASGRAFGGVRR